MGAAVAALAIAPPLAGRGAPGWAGAYRPSRLWPGLLGSLESLKGLSLEAGLSAKGYAKIVSPSGLADAAGVFAPGRAERGVAPGEGAVVQEGERERG